MTDRQLDHILGEQPEMQPSANFVTAVMHAVRRDAATPPPIPFPRLVALPMIAAWILTVLAVILAPLYGTAEPAAPGSRFAFDWGSIRMLLGWVRQAEVFWVSIALLLTLACVGLPLRLIRGRF